MSEAREATDDQSLFERIWYAERDRLLLIGVDLRHYNRKDSPTHSPFDNGLPLVATLCCTASAWMLGGWIWGLAILTSGIILTLTTLNVWVMHRLRQRTLALALSGLAGWQEAWRYGGITLRLAEDGPEGGRRRKDQATGGSVRTGRQANAPADDWRVFVRRYLPEAAD